MAAWLKKLVAEQPNELRLVVRLFPVISAHDKAALAAQAAEAAAQQNKFWEMYDILFNGLNDWNAMSADQFEAWLINQAAALGLDVARFKSDLKSDAIIQKIQNDWTFGQKRLPSPPLMLLNGRVQSPPYFYDSINQTIKLIALGKRQFTSCPPIVIDPLKQYIVTLHTVKGDVVIQLYPDKAPNTVNNFVFLAQHGWYDNITFHRVIPGFVVQTGDPSGTGIGNPGYFINNEIDATMKFDRPGLVGMMNAGADTNGSQFFITLAAAPQLNGMYTIFGEVLSGMDVLTQISARNPQPGIPLLPGDALISVSVEEK